MMPSLYATKFACFFAAFIFASSTAIAQRNVLPLQAGKGLETSAVGGNVGPKRVALILGNRNYSSLSKLGNPINDARLIEAVLKTKLGFSIIVGGEKDGFDLTGPQMADLLDRFKKAAKDADAAIVYYAGHGLFRAGDAEQYLAGVEYSGNTNALSKQSISLSEILETISEINGRFNLVFLDACREVVRGSSETRGNISLKRDPPRTAILYATAAADVALDGKGQANSPFTTALADELAKPGNEWSDVKIGVINRVKQLSGQAQQPREYSSFGEKLYFSGAPTESMLKEQALVRRMSQGDSAAMLELLESNPKIKEIVEQRMKQVQIASNQFVSTPEEQTQATKQRETQLLGEYSSGSVVPSKANAIQQASVSRVGKSTAVTLQTIAATVGQEASSNASERELGRAMQAFLSQGNGTKAQFVALTDSAEDGNVFAGVMLVFLFDSNAFFEFDRVRAKNVFRIGIEQVKKLANSGNVLAKTWLARVLMEGAGDEKKDEKHAFELMREAALEGSDAAQDLIGSYLYYGRGVQVNFQESAFWYSKAATGGNSEGMTNLGVLYATGKGVARDEELAVAWYRKAADAGNLRAMSLLGQSYEIGRGIPKDEALAVSWYQKAAVVGDIQAMIEVGRMYYYGNGVVNDDVQAFEWYKKASDSGDQMSTLYLGAMYEKGRGVAKDSKQSVALYRRLAESGNALGMWHLGRMYRRGLGIEKNETLATIWYQRSADSGDSYAMSDLAYMIENGKGVAKNEALAVAWYRKAADAGNPAGMSNLGVMYEHGVGVDKDEATAVAWFRKSADKGHIEAMINLAGMLKSGRGISKDLIQASGWYKKASQGGNSRAMARLANMLVDDEMGMKNQAEAYRLNVRAAELGEDQGMSNLGWMFETGTGVAKSLDIAISWYEKAAAAGSTYAARRIAEIKP
jgi:TPR repeat protein/uncharacterized caspase-like protein